MADRPHEPALTIAHDYLTQRGGAERVVLAMSGIFPDAAIHTLLYDEPATYPAFGQTRVVPSWLNAVDWLRTHYRNAMPVLAVAASTTRVSGDTVLVSSSGWAHGIRVEGRKVVYCHTPARWLYRSKEYLGTDLWRSPKGLGLLMVRPGLRWWDRRAARSADLYLVNSTAIRDAVRATYGIEPVVVHPPTTLSAEDGREPLPGVEPGYFLVVSRLLPYKHVDQVVNAFRGTADRLVIIGSGPTARQLQQDLPANVQLFSDIDDAHLRWAYANTKGLIAASFEDFGLTPVEAAQFGAPTIAIRSGGYLDTVFEGINGVFFDTVSPAAIREAVDRFALMEWDTDVVKKTAEPFTPQEFAVRLRAAIWGAAETDAQETGRTT